MTKFLTRSGWWGTGEIVEYMTNDKGEYLARIRLSGSHIHVSVTVEALFAEVA